MTKGKYTAWPVVPLERSAPPAALTKLELRQGSLGFWWVDAGEPALSYGPFESEEAARWAKKALRLALGEGDAPLLVEIFSALTSALTKKGG